MIRLAVSFVLIETILRLAGNRDGQGVKGSGQCGVFCEPTAVFAIPRSDARANPFAISTKFMGRSVREYVKRRFTYIYRTIGFATQQQFPTVPDLNDRGRVWRRQHAREMITNMSIQQSHQVSPLMHQRLRVLYIEAGATIDIVVTYTEA